MFICFLIKNMFSNSNFIYLAVIIHLVLNVLCHVNFQVKLSNLNYSDVKNRRSIVFLAAIRHKSERKGKNCQILTDLRRGTVNINECLKEYVNFVMKRKFDNVTSNVGRFKKNNIKYKGTIQGRCEF